MAAAENPALMDPLLSITCSILGMFPLARRDKSAADAETHNTIPTEGIVLAAT